MKQSLLAATLAVGLAAPALLADDAKERGGGGGGSSSAMDRAPSSSASGHSSSSSGSSGGDSSSSYSSSSHSGTPTTAAESRHPRPGTGHAYHGHGGGGSYYYPYYYGGYAYYGYPYYYGYWSYDPFYGPYGPYAPYHSPHDDYGALRVLVEPTRARVYVDGYYAGAVDDFDGLFQHLDVAPGKHEFTLKLEGYRTHRVRLYVPVDHTIKLRFNMVKGEGEDPVDDQGGPADSEPDVVAKHDPDGDEDHYARREPPRRDAIAGDRMVPVGGLRLHVTPEDASVYVDGRFRGTSRQLDELVLPSGRHHVEVVRPGYRTFDEDVEVAPEQPTSIKVALDKL